MSAINLVNKDNRQFSYFFYERLGKNWFEGAWPHKFQPAPASSVAHELVHKNISLTYRNISALWYFSAAIDESTYNLTYAIESAMN